MADAGMSIESHSKNHVDLRGRDYDFLVYEMLGSLESLEYYTGRAARMFCYPIGHWDAAALSVLRGLPVLRAVTTARGAYHTTDNRLLLSRLRITPNTGVNGLAQLLELRE
jgi:peptidoglycan/xylan/chitin deacetylase (PgdA/CDA1 family)